MGYTGVFIWPVTRPATRISGIDQGHRGRADRSLQGLRPRSRWLHLGRPPAAQKKFDVQKRWEEERNFVKYGEKLDWDNYMIYIYTY